jgi:hypothetical protein
MDIPVWKAKEWKGDKQPEKIVEIAQEFRDALQDQEWVVIGALLH